MECPWKWKKHFPGHFVLPLRKIPLLPKRVEPPSFPVDAAVPEVTEVQEETAPPEEEAVYTKVLSKT
jgi:hypothetical protein